MKFKKFLIIFILIFFNIRNIDTNVKVALIGTGHLSDLYYDYQTNLSLKQVEKQFKSKLMNFYGNVSKEICESHVVDLIENKGYQVILAPSLNHQNCMRKLSDRYFNQSIYFLLRGGGVMANNNRTMVIDFNYEITYYILGYYAGLITKTNKVGFVSAGPPIFNNYVVNAFYVGAFNANPYVTAEYFTVGTWLDPELSTKATEKLITLDIDMVGANLEDLSVSFTMIENGKYAVGGNGIDQSKVFGLKIPISYTLNWASRFALLVAAAENSTTLKYSDRYFYGGTLNGFLNFELDPSLDPTIASTLNRELVILKANSRSNSLAVCNIFNKYLLKDVNPSSGCVLQSRFIEINDPYPGMNWISNYTIPMELQGQSVSITKVFIIVSCIFILLSLILSASVIIFKDKPTFRYASPTFCILIIIGGIIAYTGIMVWVIPVTSITCNLRYWLLSEGYTILIGSLVVKNFRIWLIFDNQELKPIRITNLQLFPWIFILLLINSFLMAIISYRGGGQVEKLFNVDSLDKYEYLQTCSMNQIGWVSLYSLLCYFGVLLTVGLFVSWKIRIVDIPEFNESKPIANTLYTIAFSLTIIVSLVVSQQTNQNQTIILCISGLFITTSTLFILFVPKLLNLNSHYFAQNRHSIISTIRYISSKPYLNYQNIHPQHIFAQFTDNSISRNSKNSTDTYFESRLSTNSSNI